MTFERSSDSPSDCGPGRPQVLRSMNSQYAVDSRFRAVCVLLGCKRGRRISAEGGPFVPGMR